MSSLRKEPSLNSPRSSDDDDDDEKYGTEAAESPAESSAKTSAESHAQPGSSPQKRRSYGAVFYMIVFFFIAAAFMVAHHFFYAFLDGRPAESVSLLALLHVKLPITISNQSLVNAISNGIALIVQNILAAVIACAFAQVFWWRMPLKGKPEPQFNKLSDKIISFHDNPLDPTTWSALFSLPLLAIIGICGALLTVTSVAGPGSLTVTSAAFDEDCQVPTVDLTHANLTNMETPQIASNGSTVYTYSNPNGRALSLVTRVLMAGSYFAPASPCGTCQYNISFVAPAVQCTNITQMTNFTEALPDVDADTGGTWVWNGTYSSTYLEIASRNELLSSPAAPALLPTDAQPVVALLCAAYNATYHVSVDQNVTTTMSVARIDTGTQLTHDAALVAASTPSPLAHQLLALWDAFGAQLAGGVQYVGAVDAFAGGSSWVAWSAVSDGSAAGVAWQWAGDLSAVVPAVMQNVSLSLLAWQQETAPDNATWTMEDATCRVARLRYTYDRLRLLLTYGATLVLTAVCMLCGLVGVRRLGTSASLDFSKIVEWARRTGGQKYEDEREV